jgi:hypothetical protein
MYYAYLHRLSASEMYGACFVCGEVCLNLHTVYECSKMAFDDAARKGVLFRFDSKGVIRKNVADFSNEAAEVDGFFLAFKEYLTLHPKIWEPLPSEDLTIPLDSVMRLSIEEDPNDKIIRALRHYHNVHVTLKNDLPSSYARTVSRLSAENASLHSKNKALNDEISRVRREKRNTLWVGILSLVVAVFGLVIYFKVINPSEVSKYQTSEFLYYGPIKDKEPNGEGVAFYPSDDPDGRRYYIGNFDNGERNDTEAMLYYQSGDYFYGTMVGDQWDEGIFYSNSTGSHFVGSFVNNEPSDGTWYRHEEAYRVKNGKPVRY